MLRHLSAFALASSALSTPAFAQDWTVGKQTPAYTSGHQLGDGSNSRGGEAPYFASEPADIPTDSTTKSTWTLTCSSIMSCGGLPIDSVGEILPPHSTFNASITGTNLHVNSITTGPGPAPGMHLKDVGIAPLTYVISGSGSDWTVNVSQTVASMTMDDGGFEAKARFDCNDAYDEPSDFILKPFESLTSMHDHHFFGNKAAQGNAASVNYAWLRAHGDSTCFGRPMNRTAYWEPTVYQLVNGVWASMKAYQIPTYYVTGGMSEAPLTSRWPRGFAMIFGFDISDPTNQRMQDLITAAGSVSGGALPLSLQPGGSNGFVGWTCPNPDTPSYTAYAPNQTQGAYQPYLNDGMGHNTLRCLPSGTVGGITNGIEILGEVDSPQCWDGKNPRSVGGRDHMAQLLKFWDGNLYCPDHWYRTIAFIARPYFVFKDMNEVANVHLSSDRMPNMPMARVNAHFSGTTMTVDSVVSGSIFQVGHPITGTGIPANTYIVSGSGSTWTINTSLTLSSRSVDVLYFGGQTFHADLIPAWDYGTGDNPGFMVSFFRDCDGISMHLKNSDGVTYTDLVGNPHECNFGRAGLGLQTWTWQSSPDSSPALQIDPNMVGLNRYFPVPKGTAINGTVLHQKH